jgi:hypothetical protein
LQELNPLQPKIIKGQGKYIIHTSFKLEVGLAFLEKR